ncbi:LemA family protein [Dolosigranulum pigrum]|uniref:LemA family protein n=1 Tax=Dolosigranulum pigrum TaxID=29394 RepID=UPI001AD85AE8|nr:LemA family protein [Dolosigranulum pigrum]QTJ44947.1 LemA family protein [Dolosigranulum pigrum]
MNTWIILGIILVIILGMFGLYNGLVRKRNAAEQMFAQIDVELQRRNDLVPNLVNTVKGYAAHEKELLESVTKARQQLIHLPDSASNKEKLAKSDELSGALGRLLAVSESYPDLKANQNFLQLQEELTNTENRISGSRQSYNRAVMQYNQSLETVPQNFIASLFNFKPMTYHEAPQEARNVPNVQF